MTYNSATGIDPRGARGVIVASKASKASGAQLRALADVLTILSGRHGIAVAVNEVVADVVVQAAPFVIICDESGAIDAIADLTVCTGRIVGKDGSIVWEREGA
jgi:hypothetical protein